MNAQQLQQALNEAFDAFTGPPRAFIDIETRHETPEHARDPFPRMRLYYSVYKLVVEADASDPADYEGKLCDEMLQRFFRPLTVEDCEDRMATLIWRRDARYRCEPIYSAFDDGNEDDASEFKQVDTGRVRHSLSLRAYCPRVPNFEETLT